MTKTLPVLSFAKLDQGMPMAHLLDIQTRAFQSLMQPDGKGAERTDVGLERVFKHVFPIQDVNGNYSLELVKYRPRQANNPAEECSQRDMTSSEPRKPARPPATRHGTNADVLKLFYATRGIDIPGKREGRAQKREVLGTRLGTDVPDPENKKGEPLGKVGGELTLEEFNTFRRAGISKVTVFAGYTSLDLRDEAQPTTTRERQGAYILAFDVADPGTGEGVAEGGRELSDALKKKLLKSSVNKVDVLLPPGRNESALIKNTLLKDPTHTEAEALEQIYALLRPGEAPNLETARQALERLFFHPKRYDLGRVGRYKINQRLKVNVAKDHTVL